MTLRPTPDVSAADWFATADAHWTTLVAFGPPGLDAHARIHLDLAEDGRSETEVFADVVHVLTAHTSTPDDAFFGLWDGWGDIHGGRGELHWAVDRSAAFGRVFTPAKPPAVPPAFDPAVTSGPKVHVEARDYYLFAGPLSEAGDWGARPVGPDWPSRAISEPNLMWPADRSWFVGNDVDPDWIGMGGSEEAVAALVAHPRLHAERVDYVAHPPQWDDR